MIDLDLDLASAATALRRDAGIVSGLRLASELAWSAARSSDPRATMTTLRRLVENEDDQLVVIGAVHAMSAAAGALPAPVLTELLDDPRPHVNEHAAWALSARSPHRSALGRLASFVALGGFRGMLAQRTLRGWATGDPLAVAAAVAGHLEEATDGARAALVETLGLVPGAVVEHRLVRVAADPGELGAARRAAVAALGDRPLEPAARELLKALAGYEDELGRHALLALLGQVGNPQPEPSNAGLRIAQVYLYADLETGLDRAGAGDQGGIATLLALLADAMAARPDVTEVRSITRGSVEDALTGPWTTGATVRFERVPFGPDGHTDARSAWSHRIAIERGIRRALATGSRPHVVHLRLADVGTLAADAAARRLGIPVVFTAAPDPHSVLESLHAGGQLGRDGFGDSDSREHWWFRARMVEQLTARADRVALLPRRGAAGELHRLLGVDVTAPAGRCVVIPEGIHGATTRRAAADVRAAATGGTDAAGPPSGVDALADAIAALSVARRALPLVLTVGRLHPVKGIDRVVRAWMTTDLATTSNLVVVGGDLTNPTADEMDVLATIDDILAESPDRAEGIILLGHRPHGEVARILAAAAVGFAPHIAPGGVYVSGALKEEFGLAIVEALAAGLPVVAPQRGGPATYIDDGRNGRLVDTTSVNAIATGIGDALVLARDRTTVDAAAAEVLELLTIEAMADRLVSLYTGAALVEVGPP